MLRIMRENTKAIIWITIGIFVLCYVIGSAISAKSQNAYAAKIFNKKISHQDYQNFYDIIFYSPKFQNLIRNAPNIPESFIMNTAIQYIALYLEAKRRKIKVTKKALGKIEDIKDGYDDISLIMYSQVKKTGLKKKPDLAEVGIKGNLDEKLSFIKENQKKEFSIFDVFENGQLVDLRGLTTGRGFQGPVKRFGIKLKRAKSEKGRRRPGNVGPWHPARVTFRIPMAGQLGMFTRVHYNQKIIDMGKAYGKEATSEANSNLKISKITKLKDIKNYGKIKTDYILVRGSVQGPSKRQLLITTPLRASKKQTKKDYELLELK